MIKNSDEWQKWEDDFNRRQPVDFSKNLAVMEAMYEETKALNRLSYQEPLEGLDAVMRYAKAINVPTPPNPHRQGT